MGLRNRLWQAVLPSTNHHSPKVVIYTCIFGNTDKLKSQNSIGADLVSYTNPKVDYPGYESRYAKDKYQDPRMSARWYKMAPDILFPEADYTLWLDGNISLKVPVQTLIDKYLQKTDIALFHHPYRDNIFDEADACIRLGKAPRELAEKQVMTYKDEGFPGNILGETGILLRRNTPKVSEFNRKWMTEIERWTMRDQLSFGYVSWITRTKFTLMEGDMRFRPEFDFTYHN